MKYGIFSDIHSNLQAFEKVLSELKAHKPDAYICPGDVVGYGANPKECLDMVRDLDPLIVGGNHDWAVVDKISVEYFNLYAREAVEWTREQLTKDDLNYLENLPLRARLDGITLCHSTIFRPELFSYIQTSYDAHLSFESLETRIGFVGHSHIPVTFLCKDYISFSLEELIILDHDERALVNVGSVGQPRDENPLAAYGIYDTDTQTIEIFRVEYDIKAASDSIKKAGLPAILGDRLHIGQ